MDESEIEALRKRVATIDQNTHIPYEETSGLMPDFEVEYEFNIDTELRGIKPGQGMRCDFLYEGDDPSIDGIHMIWPQLLDERGDVITDKRVIPSEKGRATMWIGLHDSRQNVHRNRIKAGVTGSWVVGSKK